MSIPVAQRTFAGGELSPTAFGRVDLSVYEKSARTLRNMICMKHGGVSGRPGTMYVSTTLNGENPVRLIPFVFNETGLGQSYMLEFGNQYIAFHQNGAVVVTVPGGSIPYTIPTPYLQEDLPLLNFEQSADVLTLVNQNYQVRELRRLGPINWTLSGISNWGSNFPAPTKSGGPITISGTGGSGALLAYQVTSVDTNGNESDSQSLDFGFANVLSLGFLPPSATNPITLNWDPVTNAVFYRVYATVVGSGASSTYGFIGQTNQAQFSDPGITPDFSNSYPIYTQFFGNDGGINNPAIVGFSQQRRYFANTKANPIGFWGSRLGSYSNFDSHITSQDDDAVVGSLAGQEVNLIQTITELKFMLMLTAGAEIYVQGDGSGVVKPSAINASVQSQYGCAPLRPLKCADILIFNQALGSFVRDFAFDFAIDGYRGNDISIFASHLFEGYTIADWCYQKVPDSIIWVARSDGKLLSCTYIREQQVLAWTHHDLTNGFVENLCAIPENGQYAVYASVRRVINGATVRYIERVSSRIWQGPTAAVAAGTANPINDPINAPFCDSFSQYDGRNTSPTTMTLNPLIPAATYTFLFKDASNNFSTTFPEVITTTPPGGNLNGLLAVLISAMNTESSGYSFSVVGGRVVFSNSIYRFQLISSPLLSILGFPDSTGSDQQSYAAPQPPFNSTSEAYKQTSYLVSSIPYFGPGQTAQIGDEIFLEDSLWISSQGRKGNYVRCLIQIIVDSTHVIITPNSTIPVEFQLTPITIWARAVKTISGLGYLQGQQVSVWADRFVVGSPLNQDIKTIYTIPPSGILTLDKPYSVIYVGLPMIQDVETLDLETYFGETILGRRKRVAGLQGYIYQTRSFYAGSENPDTNNQNSSGNPLFQLFPLRTGISQDTYDQPPELLTNQDYLITMARWNKRGGLFMRNVDPVPWTLLAVSPKEEDATQGQYKRV